MKTTPNQRLLNQPSQVKSKDKWALKETQRAVSVFLNILKNDRNKHKIEKN